VGSQHYVPVVLEMPSFGKALVLKIGLGSYFWEIKKKYFVRREVPRYFVLEGKLESQRVA
jgi:hypothetical protein